MLRVSNIRLDPGWDEAALRRSAARRLRVSPGDILSLRIHRQSVDARDKRAICFMLTVDVTVRDERRIPAHATGVEIIEPRVPAPVPRVSMSRRPVVVGAGPAGLFAALWLALAGAKPILLERGKPVEERALDVQRMRRSGILDPASNVQFGEGGAGAFSDGKLTTGIKSPLQRDVLESLVRHGAPDEILYLQKPHIGTDLLRGIVASIRSEIMELGGTVCFSTEMLRLIISDGRLRGVTARRGDKTLEFITDSVILAIGHSARDTVRTLFNDGVPMAQKPFAVGLRIEHRQSMIDKSQYGAFAGHPQLGPASYKLSVHTPDGRGVYTFCMCPGGEVIAAASEPNRLVVNGMSFHARDGENANSALLVGVPVASFPSREILSGFELQQRIEERAFRLGGGGFRAPVQLVGDFLEGRTSTSLGTVRPTYCPGYTLCDLHDCLPDEISADLAFGIRRMDAQLHGFASPDAVLTGVETRSSSPVRMLRGDDFISHGIQGLYPAGEGAGYAGGIVSAAVDGIRAALSLIERSRS